MSSRTFSAAQWQKTKPLPRGCAFERNDPDLISCHGSGLRRAVFHEYRRPPSSSPVSQPAGTGRTLSEPSPSNGVSPSTSMPAWLDTIGAVISNVTGSGRGNTSAPSSTTSDTGTGSLIGDIIRVAGTAAAAIIPGSAATGTALGTLAELGTDATSGRALSTDLPLEAEPGMTPTQTVAAYQRGRRMPSTNKVRRLVRIVGVVGAASMLGLTVPATAMIAVRPYRRRGISAASLRITRRTIRAVSSIQHSLSKLTHHRRR
jgi:hypothetical protein